MDSDLSKQTILVADDAPENINILRDILAADYKVKIANSGEEVIESIFSDTPPDMVLLDTLMPDMDGYEVCSKLKADPRTEKIPVIFVAEKGEVDDKAHGFKLGAADYITKPVSPPIVRARVRDQLVLADQNRTLKIKVRQRASELNESYLGIIKRLAHAAEFKENETGHATRVSCYSRIIGKAIGMHDTEADVLLNATPMHDIGKISIPDNILLKPGKLDEDEWNQIKKHPELGANIIGDHDSELLRMARVIALTHHEKWNGKGYPNGIAGEDIPLVGRIVAIADVFDALTTERPYKDAWPVEKAFNLIKEGAGEHFDPKLVEAFLKNMAEVLEIKARYAETSYFLPEMPNMDVQLT